MARSINSHFNRGGIYFDFSNIHGDSGGGGTTGGNTGGGSAGGAIGSCNLYNTNSSIPTGYGVPWNLLSSSRELLLTSICGTFSVDLRVGQGDPTHYIYNQGYSYQNGAWQPFTLAGTYAQGSNAWLVGGGEYTLNNPSIGITYWVGYVCQWQSATSQWQCGCRDSSCTQNYWQLQGVVR